MKRRAATGAARRALRRLRASPLARPLVQTLDRSWWTRTILAADIVDPDLIAAQGFRSARHAVRAYVRGGFRQGVVLNPLLMERLVASQLSDVGRVPALYAYLINDRRTIRTSVNWDAPGYAARHPDSLTDPAGPLGHAWRRARREGWIGLGTGGAPVRVAWPQVLGCVQRDTEIAPAGRPARLLYVCEIAPNASNLADALESVITLADEGVESVIRLDRATAGDSAAAMQVPLWMPGVRVVDERTPLTSLEATTQATTLLVRGPEADIDVASLRRLARAGGARPAAPLWLGPDGTIVSAGMMTHDGRAFPLLAGHPSEDAIALGSEVPVVSRSGRTFARPVGAKDSVGAVTVTDAIVRTSTSVVGAHIGAPSSEIDTSRLDALLAPASLRVAGWRPDGCPELARVRRTVTLEDGSQIPSLRWAIKIAAPPGPPGEYWGDTHFARGLADALRRLGQDVVIDAYAARDRATGALDDVVLALRGPEPISPSAHARSLLWVISHPDEITASQLDGFHRVFAASATWAQQATRSFGRRVEPLLQCTDAHRFRPRGQERTSELLFVGTARGIARPVVVEPLRAGIPVRVYGPDWTGYIPASAVVARSIPNSELPALYERAGAVLNDHWPAMQRNGFVSNRLFDVVASGGRAVSDEVAGIQEIFGGAIRTFRDTEELLSLLRGDLDALFPDAAALVAIGARIRAEHSFDARARVLLDAALTG